MIFMFHLILWRHENKETCRHRSLIPPRTARPEGKGNGRVNLSERKLNKYFPARMTAKERERIIIELLEKWKAEKENK